jgi:pilus assembly protein CpaB
MRKPDLARIRVFVVFVIAITAGAVFAFGTYRYVQQAPAKGAQMKTVPVVVAATDLQIGAEIRPEDIRIIEWPAGSVPQTAFRSGDDVAGRGVIAPMVQYEPVLPEKLASKDAGAGLPPAIPPGMRALSVSVNEVIGVAGYVLPGTHVDVLVTVNPTQNQTDVTSKVILSDVLVLASGTKIERDSEDNEPMAVTVVTLLVDPIEAERLTLASTEGKTQLALRNPLDKTEPATPGIRPAALLSANRAAMPAASTPAPRPAARAARPAAQPTPQPAPVAISAPAPTVEIIRGDKRAQEVVRQE